MSDEPFLCVPTPPDPVAVLRAENERLRAEVERLRTALDRLARLGNEPHYGNSVGNEIARDALKENER